MGDEGQKDGWAEWGGGVWTGREKLVKILANGVTLGNSSGLDRDKQR